MAKQEKVENSAASKRYGWNGGSWISKHKRLAIYLRDGFLCCYCGSDLHDAKPSDINLDHIKPRSKGGSNSETNLITACKSCNSQRQAKSVKEYATGGAFERIQKNRYRSLKAHLVLAKAIIAGKTGNETENER